MSTAISGTTRCRPPIPQPVTVGDLLTHSAGIDDALTGTAARDERAAVPLGDWLARRRMARFAPPGAVYSYTNNGPALAGLVVERASGKPFATYAQRHIFAPLEMRRSTFAPDFDDPVLAVGYDFDGERFVARPHDVILPAPSAGLVTSGADMGRFMLAHLNGGAVGTGADPQPGGYRAAPGPARSPAPPACGASPTPSANATPTGTGPSSTPATGAASRACSS